MDADLDDFLAHKIICNTVEGTRQQWLQKMLLNGFFDPNDRQTNDVFERAFVFGDQGTLVFLRGVAARFIEGIDPLEVVENHFIGERMKLHPADIDESDESGVFDQTNARHDFVNPTRERGEHGLRVFEIAGLAEDFTIETDDGIRADDAVIGKSIRDVQCLRLGIR